MRKLSRTLKLRKFQFVKHYANGRKVTEKIATFNAGFDAQNYADLLVSTYGGEIIYIDIIDKTESINNPITSIAI
jgi:hypothetical protein